MRLQSQWKEGRENDWLKSIKIAYNVGKGLINEIAVEFVFLLASY